MSAQDPVGTDPATRAPGAAEMMRRRRLGWIVFAVVVSVALLVFGYFAYGAFTARLDAARKLDTSTTLIEDADAIVVQVDRVVREPVTPELATEARGALERVQDAKATLDRAVRQIDEATPALRDDERERAELLRAAAAARLDMLEEAPELLELNAQAAEALPLAQAGWKDTLSARASSDGAVKAFNRLNKAGVQESAKLNKQAATQIARAKESFTAAEKAFPQADTEAYIAYLESRARSNKLSQQSDAAWLKGDIVKANALVKLYNAEDKKSTALAKKLPTTPEAAISSAFETAVAEATERYNAARDAATKADERFREW